MIFATRTCHQVWRFLVIFIQQVVGVHASSSRTTLGWVVRFAQIFEAVALASVVARLALTALSPVKEKRKHSVTHKKRAQTEREGIARTCRR